MFSTKDVYILIPKTCEYITLHGKRDFAHGIKLRILRWGDDPGLSSWVQCNHKSSYKREAGGSESEGPLCSLKSTQVMMEETAWTVATELVSCSPVNTRLSGQEEGCLSPSVTVAIFNKASHVMLVRLSSIHLYLNFLKNGLLTFCKNFQLFLIARPE